MTRMLFIDRDGTLIEEPADGQIDAFEKLSLVAGVIPALLNLREAGFQFVMVSNQDGLGSAAFPRADFDGPQRLLLALLASQGIDFREVLIDTSFEHEQRPTRKPGLGLVQHYLRDRAIDLDHSAVIGDRPSDLEFASALGVPGFQLRSARFGGEWDWPGIAHALAERPRTASLARRTRETEVDVALDLDRSAEPEVHTGIGMFDHMLCQLGTHGGFALQLACRGDLEVDEHHTIEDCALVLGTALARALGDKRGIGRYGQADGAVGAVALRLPMDESLAAVTLDVSGRACFVFEGAFPRPAVGQLPTEMVPHFFRSLCEAAGLTLHLSVRGENTHHMVEACFKAVGRALRSALRREGRALPSTKGVL